MAVFLHVSEILSPSFYFENVLISNKSMTKILPNLKIRNLTLVAIFITLSIFLHIFVTDLKHNVICCFKFKFYHVLGALFTTLSL